MESEKVKSLPAIITRSSESFLIRQRSFLTPCPHKTVPDFLNFPKFIKNAAATTAALE